MTYAIRFCGCKVTNFPYKIIIYAKFWILSVKFYASECPDQTVYRLMKIVPVKIRSLIYHLHQFLDLVDSRIE